jgi:glycosyltransferase involved in cell wall biosynthesis
MAPQRPRPRRPFHYNFRQFFFVLSFAHLFLAVPNVSAIRFSVRELCRGLELSILMVIYNKSSYLYRSLPSIANLSLSQSRFELVCVDDGSTDNSTDVVRLFAVRFREFRLILHGANLGTHRARITAVRAARAPFLTFLDPDDEFTGNGLEVALDTIQIKDADIVEFACHTVLWNETLDRCWMTPRIREAKPARFKRLFYRARLNPHVHRKVIRTELYLRALDAMSPEVLNKRLLRYEDKLHYAFIVENMTRNFYFLKILGELRYWGLADNSRSETYQSLNESEENDEYVRKVIFDRFGQIAK